MGLGKLLLSTIGLKLKYQPFFEKFLKLGLMGMGYEQPMRSHILEAFALQNTLKNIENPIIFDVGANKGQYIQLVKDSLRKPCIIHAFEPDPTNYSLLNKKKDKDYIINNLGLGEKAEKLKFYKHRQSDLSSLYHDKNHPSNYRNKELDEVVDIKVETIDFYCKQHNIDHIDFLKIDTEGHELYVLKGASEMINNKKIGCIQFEFSEMNISSSTTFFDFWNALSEKYDLYRPCKDGLYKIKQYIPALHEIYYPINFLARTKR